MKVSARFRVFSSVVLCYTQNVIIILHTAILPIIIHHTFNLQPAAFVLLHVSIFHKSNAAKYHALSYLFLKDMEVKSSKYWTRHWKVRARLLQLLAENESRLIYVRDYLKYGSCGCLTRVIQVMWEGGWVSELSASLTLLLPLHFV